MGKEQIKKPPIRECSYLEDSPTSTRQSDLKDSWLSQILQSARRLVGRGKVLYVKTHFCQPGSKSSGEVNSSLTVKVPQSLKSSIYTLQTVILSSKQLSRVLGRKAISFTYKNRTASCLRLFCLRGFDLGMALCLSFWDQE